MKIQMVEKSALVSIISIVAEIEKQWRENGAITEDETLVFGTTTVGGAGYIYIMVKDKPSRIIKNLG